MRRSTEILWQALAAASVGAIAYHCVMGAEPSTGPLLPPSATVRGLAGGVAVAAAGIAAFMTGCMFRDPDLNWPKPAACSRVESGSGHDMDVVG